MTSFAVVGSGFRSAIFWNVAAGLDGIDCVGVVTRRPRALPVPAFESLDALLRERAVDFLVTSTPISVTPQVVVDAVERGLPVLAETPPAGSPDEVASLWRAVGDSGMVQVAEQYHLMPLHAARLAAVRGGLVGRVGQVHVSSTQLYHAVSLLRRFLGVGVEAATVRAARFVAPLVDPLDRGGWTGDLEPHDATTTLATLDFGDGRSGLYDFTDNQTRNLLRTRRLLVRGSHGELSDETVVRLVDATTITRTSFTRRQTGHDLDQNGYATDHVALGDDVYWRNPWPLQRWSDDELAIAELLTRTAAWVDGDGPEPYPLLEACTDQVLALAMTEAAESGQVVRVDPAAVLG
ncbi:MAG TPA: Gfo/Idh/MocA family oxidoreductase [Propionibacteriaceae bacterium]|nr:Gfo/Idh/MocA family oxidoreductase [Propionibacteriaceae bacterium]